MAGGTYGLALTLDHIVDFKKAVSIDNDGTANLAYITNPKVEAVLSKLKDRFSSLMTEKRTFYRILRQDYTRPGIIQPVNP